MPQYKIIFKKQKKSRAYHLNHIYAKTAESIFLYGYNRYEKEIVTDF